jgi:hypothetical protein
MDNGTGGIDTIGAYRAKWSWTWGELKQVVESTGATKDTLISYIDISNNGFNPSILAVLTKSGELEVS